MMTPTRESNPPGAEGPCRWDMAFSRMVRRGLRLGFFLLCFIYGSAPTCSGATITWDGGGTNAFWDTVTNWSGNALPANGDTVAFGSAFTSGSTINLNGNRTANILNISTLSGFTITNSTLTLTSGDITRSDIAGTEADHTITSAIALGADGAWNIAGSGSLIVSGVISGAHKLTKNGTGSLILSGNNTFSDTFKLDQGGTVSAGHNNAFGTGTLELKLGTIQAYGAARTITNSLNMSGDFTIGGSLDLTFTGDIKYGADRTLTVDSTGVTTLSGSFTDAHKLYKEGAGTLVLSGSANNQNETYVNAGVLNIQNAGALSGTDKKTVVASGAALEIQGGITVGSEPLELNGSGISNGGALRNVSGINVWDGKVTLKANSTIGSDAGTLTINGVIDDGKGSFTLTKEGAGTLALNGVNTFAGAATINAGTVAINSSDSLGAAASATINNGTLKVTSSFTDTRNYTLGSASSTMQIDSGVTYTYNGVASSTGGLTKTGTGTLLLGGANTFTGTLSVNAGTVKLGAANRISNSANVSLGGGVFHSGGYSETVGTLTLAEDSIIDLGASASVLHFGDSSAMAWTAGKTLTITNWNGTWLTGGGTDQLFFGTNSSALTSGQLAQIRFADPNGYYTRVSILSNGEIVPVPEPATVIAVILVVGLVLYRERRLVGVLWLRLRPRRGQGRGWNASLPNRQR